MSQRLNVFDKAVRQAAASPAAAAPDLGALPEWRLDDLYSGMDSPDFAADMQRAIEEAKAFAQAYRGKLEAIAARFRRRRKAWGGRARL